MDATGLMREAEKRQLLRRLAELTVEAGTRALQERAAL
jgi:hypothetical protein